MRSPCEHTHEKKVSGEASPPPLSHSSASTTEHALWSTQQDANQGKTPPVFSTLGALTFNPSKTVFGEPVKTIGPSQNRVVHGSRPDPRVGLGVFRISRVGSGRLQRSSKHHGSGRVGPGRVRTCSNLTGQAGSDLRTKTLTSLTDSGQEVFKISRVGSGRA